MFDQRSGAAAWKRWRDRGTFLSVLLLFTIYICIVLFHHEPPSLTDYSDWTYEGVLLSNHLKHVPDPAHFLKEYPVPNSITTIGIATLCMFLPWQMASKLWIVIMLVTFLAVSHYVLRRQSNTLALWLVNPAAIFLNIDFWYGNANFEIGLCSTVFLAALLLLEEHREWLFGILLVVIFFSHMIPFAIAALLLTLCAMQRKRYRLLLQLIPGLVLSFWYTVGRFFVAHNADGSVQLAHSIRDYSALFWAFKINTYLKSFGFVNPGGFHGSSSLTLIGLPTFVFLLAINLVLAVALLPCIASTALTAYREQASERFIWKTAFIVTPFYLFAPIAMLGVSDPGARLLQVILALTLFQIKARKTFHKFLLWIAAGCEVTLQVAAVFMFSILPYHDLKDTRTAPHLPQMALAFDHVPNHGEDYFFRALANGNLNLEVYPTAMFLNSPQAVSEPSRCADRPSPCEK